MKQCPICTQEFRPRNSKQVYCSYSCVAESYKKRITVYCQECGKAIETIPCLINRKKYCSRRCANIVANRKANISPKREGRKAHNGSCDYCGNPIQIKPWQVRDFKLHFCSRKCSALGHRIPGTYTQQPCAYCGKLYEVSFHQLTKRGSRYCSRECMNNGTRTRKIALAYYWRNIAAQVRKRDNYTCQLCGIQQSRGLHVHHKIPALDFSIEQFPQANALSNLITLCVRCHRLVEANPLLLVH